MKRFLLLLLLAFAMWELQAQIPYFASTAGDGKLYGYTSLKLRPGINTQETYTTFQYGIGNSVALGTDIYTGDVSYTHLNEQRGRNNPVVIDEEVKSGLQNYFMELKESDKE